MPTVLSVTLAIAAIVTRITAIEELAGLTIDRNTIKTYSPFSADKAILLAAYASRTDDQGAINASVVAALGDPVNPVDKPTEITYRDESSGKLKRVTKGMTGIIIELCSRDEADVEENATRGLRALPAAYEQLEGDNHEAEGNGLELIGLLAIFNPPRDGMIMDADDFVGVFPEHEYEIVKCPQALGLLCAMTGDGANDALAFSRANVGIAVEGTTDTARGAADIILTEPGLSTIVQAIRGSRIIFQRMGNRSIYACAVTIRIVVCFAILAWVHQFDFPPFVVLFTEDKFGVILLTTPVDANDDQLHTIVHLQVIVISQALILATRSHGFFFMERPSYAPMGAFCVAQLISSIIAAHGNWGFTDLHGISGGWFVWVWNIVRFIPLNWIKFATKFTITKSLCQRHEAAAAASTRATSQFEGVPMARTTSCAASFHESLYLNRVSFIRRAARLSSNSFTK
ncbi:hypothetical protein F5880DRAFT_1649333 [Lentinula raphanica]|nr:hypothetical protein F5880DRAFT_1649333 [Lentinula raphanica]